MRKNILLTFIIAVIFSVLGGVFITQGAPINNGSDDHWAWNDILSYIDFRPATSPGNIDVSSSELVGFASSSVGEILLNCNSSPFYSDCTPSWGVSNDGIGNLEGWGWNDAVGWVSFCGGQSTTDCPGAINHQVTIDENGNFFGFAWNDLVGWIQFNCADPLFSDCTPSYKVATSWSSTSTNAWVESVTFDTGVTDGAQLNSIVWRGPSPQPNGTEVRFQLAVATSSAGPWNYTWSTVDTISPAIAVGIPAPISYAAFPPSRFYRYKIWLFSDTSQTLSPQVDDVIVNWSQ